VYDVTLTYAPPFVCFSVNELQEFISFGQHETDAFQDCSVCQGLVAHQATRNIAIPMPTDAQSKPAQDVHACLESAWHVASGASWLAERLMLVAAKHDGCSKA